MSRNIDLPTSWRWVPLADVCSIERGISFPSSVMQEGLETGLIACLRTANIQADVSWDDLIYVPESYVKSSDKLIKLNDILISTANSRPLVGKVAMVHKAQMSSTFGGFIAVIRTSKLLDPYFLFSYLGSNVVQTKLSNMALQTTNIANLTIQSIAKLPIPLPTLPEQNEIVNILRYADHLRKLRADANAQSGLLAASVFNQVFGIKDKTTSYPHSKLGKIAEVVSGVTKGRNLPAHETVSVPYLRVANVQAGYLDLSEIKTIDVLPSDIEKYILHPGDVLLTEGGDFDKLGRGAILEQEIPNCIHQNHVFRVRVNTELLLPLFFHYYLQTAQAKQYFLRAAKRTTNLASINITQLNAMPVPIPPLPLQEKFVTSVNQIRSVLEKQATTSAEIDHLFQIAMANAFTGNLTRGFRDRNLPELSRLADERDAALSRPTDQVEIKQDESVFGTTRSSVRNMLSPHQLVLLASIENQGTYLPRGYSEIAGNLPPNEISRNLELLVQLGLIKAVSITVTPGKLGKVFYTKVYRSLQPKDNVRDIDLKTLAEAPEE
jgi:type I restriction enzyme, S subunit